MVGLQHYGTRRMSFDASLGQCSTGASQGGDLSRCQVVLITTPGSSGEDQDSLDLPLKRIPFFYTVGRFVADRTLAPADAVSLAAGVCW